MAKYPVITYLVELAKTVGDRECVEKFHVTRAYLRLIGYGHKRPSALASAQLELNTGGKVTRKELRPDDWHLIWPELVY